MQDKSVPSVSIIIPCFNEQNTIKQLLSAILSQAYPLSEIEVIVADGMSTDNTLIKINDFIEAHPELSIRIVNNTKRSIPAALNLAINYSWGDYIIRLDAHSKPDPKYVRLSIESLINQKVDNVGGVWDIQPGADHIVAQAIAAATSHPIGVGDAYYRYATQAKYVDTVPFGAFRKSLIKKIGMFDESLLTNEDYEFNVRILEKGGHVWLNPEIRSIYYARSNYKLLAKQYWRYGYWKQKMLIRYPKSLRMRQALPPLFVLLLVILIILSLWYHLARTLLILQMITYILILVISTSPVIFKKKDIRMLILVPFAISIMHLSWGSGFLVSLVEYLLKRVPLKS